MNNLFEKSKELARYFDLSLEDIEDKGEELLGTFGLDSLTLSRIRGMMEPKPTYQVLSGLTINQILERINISNGEENVSESINLESFKFPLTPIQESYYMGALQGKPCQIYTEIDVKEIEVEVLKKAIKKVANRHLMLRAKIVDNGLQMVRENSEYDIHIRYHEDSDTIRESCIEKLRSNSDLYWNIQLSKVDVDTTRLHIIIDMIFIDAMSAMHLCREVADEYNSMLGEKTIDFYDKSKLNFVDYCESITQKEVSKETLSFWKSNLSKLPNSPNLPKTADVSSDKMLFDRETFTLKTEYWEIFKKIAMNANITPNSLIIAIFADVLKLYSENEDITLAITKSNRPVDNNWDFTGVVGNFTDVTLCPIIDRYGQDVVYKAKEINEFLGEVMEYDDISGIDVIKMLKDYYKDQHINFPVVFTSFLGIFESNIKLNGKEFTLNYQRTQTPQISLDCQIYENNKGLVVNYDFDDKIYSSELIRNIMSEMKNIMIKLALKQSAKAKIPMKSVELIDQINDTSYDFENIKSNLLHKFIEDNEKKYHSKTALIDQEYSLSYGEVLKLSRMLAGKLQQKGIEKGTHVPIVLKKGWEQVISALAVLMAGGIFVPLNHKDPEKRLSETIKSLNGKLVISNETSIDMTSVLRDNEEFEFLDITYDEINSLEQDVYNPVKVRDDQLAYIIFTSGSTGKPKGVEISHSSALNTCLDINKKFSISDSTIAFGISAFNFDLSIWDIFGVLGAGGTLVICRDDKVKDPDYWWDQIQRHNINVWNTVPTTFEMLLTAYSEDKRNYLELALLSGDAIRFSLIEKAQEVFPELQIVGLGGATEASIWSNYHVYSPTSKKLGSKLLPYGKPLANQQIYVLDKYLKYRPQNVVGDIYIGGKGLAKGYFNNEKLTQNSFIHSDIFGRLYKTGDLGRYLVNGEIEILGRSDMQIKIGGHRIELGEIERHVQAMENVIKVNVITTDTDTGYLVGFVVVKQHTGNEEIEIKEYLEKHIPTYMIPHTWITLDEMPSTPNGKVDIKKLKALVHDKTYEDKNIKKINNTFNSNSILDKVSELLNISPQKINISKSLFEQGLTSLHAVKLVNILSDMWNIKLPYSLLFNNPSVEKLMEYYKGKVSVDTQLENTDDTVSDNSIAIISSACRLPGGVKSPNMLWDMLLEKRDCITKVPTSRFDIDTIYNPNRDSANSSYTDKGAFIDNAEYFDYDFFSIPIAEAKAMDPQQRILLEVLYEACHKSGYGKSELDGSDTGVFIGQMNYDWMTNFSFNKEYAGTGVAPSITSNRISYILNLVGPSMTIDTACSSSLVAVDTAVSSLLNHSCSMAIAGGVNLILSKEPYITTCKAGMLSIDGRCATFDSKANGIARGEGVGVVVLKRLEDAKRDGNNIIGVIKGTAVNQDGKSASLTIPNGYAQENVINKALSRANIQGNDIDYIECHGTGTSLGDPIEVEAIKNTLGKNRDHPLVLGSIKTNVGHLEGAAGIVGLIKAIEVLKHKVAPGNVHFNELNPKIDLDNFDAIISSNHINIGLQKDSILASVSSFGYGGSNAHVILESWNNENRNVSKYLPDTETQIFNSKPLPWNKQNLNYETQENIIKEHAYETNWELINSSQTDFDISRKSYIVISENSIDNLPSNWNQVSNKDLDIVKAMIHSKNWDGIIVINTNRENDVYQALEILKYLSSDTNIIQIPISFVSHFDSVNDSGIQGLLKTFRLEFPEVQAQYIKYKDKNNLFNNIVNCMHQSSEEDLLIKSDKEIYGLRLNHSSKLDELKELELDNDGTYIISGGQGALGLVSLRLLVQKGAKNIILLSRSSLKENIREELVTLRKEANIELLKCDVSNETDVRKVKEWISEVNWPNVKGIIHAAGTLSDAVIQNQNSESLKISYSAKVHGAHNLHDVFLPSDFLLLFSSAAATFGSAGQGNYAAANSTLDALADKWSHNNENVLSIQWGAWSDGGMATRHSAAEYSEEIGFGSISNELGSQMIEQSLANKLTGVLCFTPINWDKFKPSTSFTNNFTSKESTLNINTNHIDIYSNVKNIVFETLGKSLGDYESLLDSGIDSLASVSFRNKIMNIFDVNLTPSLLFDYPNISAITEYIKNEVVSHSTEKTKDENYIHSNLPVLIIGAGVSGISFARKLENQGVSTIIMEAKSEIGGVWSNLANSHSKLQIDSPGYGFDCTIPPSSNTHKWSSIFPSRREIINELKEISTSLKAEVLYNTRVEKVEKLSKNEYEITYVQNSNKKKMNVSGVAAFTGGLHTPVTKEIPNENLFKGHIAYGISNDTPVNVFKNASVAILGHGAFAVENMRTAFENGADSVTIVCRKRNLVMPNFGNWLLNSSSGTMPAKDVIEVMRPFYKACGINIEELKAITKEQTGEWKINQNTVPAGSDLYFLAQILGKLKVVIAEPESLTENSLILNNGQTIECDVFLKCLGSKTNDSVIKNIFGDKTTIHGLWINEDPNLITYNDGTNGSQTLNNVKSLLCSSYSFFVQSFAQPYIDYKKDSIKFNKLINRIKNNKKESTVQILYTELWNYLEKAKSNLASHVEEECPFIMFQSQCESEWEYYSKLLTKDTSSVISLWELMKPTLDIIKKRNPSLPTETRKYNPLFGSISTYIPSKPKVLFLGGQGTNSKLSKELLNQTGWLKYSNLDFVIPDAPFKMPAFTNEEQLELLGLDELSKSGMYKKDTSYKEWKSGFELLYNNYENNTPIQISSTDHLQWNASLRYLKEVINEFGPFDGIAGFCEGAAIAHAALSLQKQGHDFGLSKTKFFIAMAPWVSPIHKILNAKYPKTILDIPTLQIVGNNDMNVFLDAAPKFAENFINHKEFRHNGKHVYPLLSQKLQFELEDLIFRSR